MIDENFGIPKLGIFQFAGFSLDAIVPNADGAVGVSSGNWPRTDPLPMVIDAAIIRAAKRLIRVGNIFTKTPRNNFGNGLEPAGG